MELTKKDEQPDSVLNEDPGSGDGGVPNWRAGLSPSLRVDKCGVIAQVIHKNPCAEEIPVSKAYTTAKMVEEGFYKEATSEHDYLTRVYDYIQTIPRTKGILQAVPVDLTSQMGYLDNSQKLQQQPLPGLLSDGNTILPQPYPQQPQPSAGLLSDSSSILPPPQQQHQHQSGT